VECPGKGMHLKISSDQRQGKRGGRRGKEVHLKRGAEKNPWQATCEKKDLNWALREIETHGEGPKGKGRRTH